MMFRPWPAVFLPGFKPVQYIDPVQWPREKSQCKVNIALEEVAPEGGEGTGGCMHFNLLFSLLFNFILTKSSVTNLRIRQFPSQGRRVNWPFARSGHMVRNKLHWDASYAVGLPKQRNSYQSTRLAFVLEVPLRNLRPSVIYSVPCDRIVQRAYCILSHQGPTVPRITARQVYASS